MEGSDSTASGTTHLLTVMDCEERPVPCPPRCVRARVGALGPGHGHKQWQALRAACGVRFPVACICRGQAEGVWNLLPATRPMVRHLWDGIQGRIVCLCPSAAHRPLLPEQQNSGGEQDLPSKHRTLPRDPSSASQQVHKAAAVACLAAALLRLWPPLLRPVLLRRNGAGPPREADRAAELPARAPGLLASLHGSRMSERGSHHPSHIKAKRPCEGDCLAFRTGVNLVAHLLELGCGSCDVRASGHGLEGPQSALQGGLVGCLGVPSRQAPGVGFEPLCHGSAQWTTTQPVEEACRTVVLVAYFAV